MANEFRRAVAELHSVEPDMVMAGNGSDDLLTILIRAFIGPGELAGFPSPSYLLYSTSGRASGWAVAGGALLGRLDTLQECPSRPWIEAFLPGQSR